MKKFTLYYILWNIYVVTLFCGLILYTLTYKSVPVDVQHLWFGQNLHTYLIYAHASMFVCMLIFLVIGNIMITIMRKE